MSDEKKPEDKTPETTSDALGSALKTPLHVQVFGSDPDGQNHETPPGAAGDRVTYVNSAVVPDGFQPMLNVGDTDRHH